MPSTHEIVKLVTDPRREQLTLEAFPVRRYVIQEETHVTFIS
jgi:hypothetical protein